MVEESRKLVRLQQVNVAFLSLHRRDVTESALSWTSVPAYISLLTTTRTYLLTSTDSSSKCQRVLENDSLPLAPKSYHRIRPYASGSRPARTWKSSRFG